MTSLTSRLVTSPHRRGAAGIQERESRRESPFSVYGLSSRERDRRGRGDYPVPAYRGYDPLRASVARTHACVCAREQVRVVDDVDDAMRAHLRVPTSVRESACEIGWPIACAGVRDRPILLPIRTLHTNRPSPRLKRAPPRNGYIPVVDDFAYTHFYVFRELSEIFLRTLSIPSYHCTKDFAEVYKNLATDLKIILIRLSK